jgi:hypothetical protein
MFSLVVVDAVAYEPVSAPEIPANAHFAGNSSLLTGIGGLRRVKFLCVGRHLGGEFPIQASREFLGRAGKGERRPIIASSAMRVYSLSPIFPGSTSATESRPCYGSV